MSPLFRPSEEKAARKAAAKQEIDRLRALSAEDLAVDLLPGLGPDGPTHGTSVRVQQLGEYLLREHPDAGRLDAIGLLAAVRRALLRLEQAGFVSSISVQRDPLWRITPDGERALAQGTARQDLAERR